MSQLKDRVIARITEFVADPDIQFTAYDVTQSLRKETPHQWIGQHEMRRLVRGLFNVQAPCFQSPDPNDPEVCTPITIDGHDALCFHRKSRNANDHPAADRPTIDDDGDDTPSDPVVQPTTLQDIANSVVGNLPNLPGAPSPMPRIVPASTVDPDVVRTTLTVESEGRLNVPASLVRGTLGLKPGGEAIANIIGGKIAITSIGVGSVYTITVRGNIRLSAEMLSRIAPAGTTTFQCEAADGAITISA